MKLILLGPPGAGKGTQAQEISKKRGLVQLSTGEMLRSAAKAGTEDGLKAEALMAKGELVPDEVVVKIIAERIEQPDCARWIHSRRLSPHLDAGGRAGPDAGGERHHARCRNRAEG